MLGRVPVFEYECLSCGKKFGLLVGMTAEPDAEVCPGCGSAKLEKLVSKFRRGRTEGQKLDDWATSLDGSGEPDSVAGMRNMVREIGGSMDDDMSNEMEEMLECDLESPE